MMSYALEVASALDEHLMSRHVATMKALAENADKIRRVEERRFGFDTHSHHHSHQHANGTLADGLGLGYADGWPSTLGLTGSGGGGGTGGGGSSKKHDMALRGRAAEDRFRIDDDILYDSERARRSRKGDHRNQKVKVQIELEENDVLADLEELRGEKRPRESDNVAGPNGPERERKAKKKK